MNTSVAVVAAEDADLELARQKRRDVVVALQNEQGEPPEDPRLLALYLANLDGLERQALGRKRLKTDESIANKQSEAAALLADMLKDPRVSRIGVGQRDEAPVLEHDVAPTRILPGELAVSNAGDNYEAFTNRNKFDMDSGAAA
jgi:hypothetical protein